MAAVAAFFSVTSRHRATTFCVDVRHRCVSFFKTSAVGGFEFGLLNPAGFNRCFHQARLTGTLFTVNGRVTVLALTHTEIDMEKVILIFHQMITADNAYPLVEVGQDPFQLVAFGLDGILGPFQIGNITKRLDDADDVALRSHKRCGGQNTGDAFAVRPFFVHVTLDRLPAVDYSVDGALLGKTGRSGKYLVAFFTNCIGLSDIGQTLEGIVDFKDIEIDVHQPHGHRSGLEDLVQLGMGLLQVPLHFFAVRKVEKSL